MIIYFSATGNNQYLANKIAQETNDECKSIISLLNDDVDEIVVGDDENLGIIFPTYFWGLPSIVEDFISNINFKLNDNSYVYIISSYGSTPGYSLGYMTEYLSDMDINVDASFNIKMPDTWTVFFDLSNEDEIRKLNDDVDISLDEIISKIANKEKSLEKNSKITRFMSNFAQVLYDRQRKTSHLRVLDNCTLCRKCENNCPIGAIQINNKPEWIYDRCVMCLRCLHSCPTFSIQYDNKTKDHGQYINPHVNNLD